jgi:uncharacterized membrane protein
MKDPRNLAIGLLILTAAFLTAMIAMSFVQTGQEAQASASSVRGAEYVFSAGVKRTDETILFVINGSVGKMAIYRVDDIRNVILPAGSVDFSRLKTLSK